MADIIKCRSDILISIIVNTYNGEKYVNQIIKALLPYSQRKEIEIILVDDGSDKVDKTIDIFSSYFPNAVVFTQINSGLASARNSGAKIAKGKYLQFIDIDDTISENKLKLQFEFAEKHGLDVVYSDWRMVVIDENRKQHFEDWSISQQQNDYKFSIINGWWQPFNSYLIAKKAYLKVGGSDENLINAQDFDLMARIALYDFKFGYIPGKHTSYYRYTSTRSLARGPRKIYWNSYLISLNKLHAIAEGKELNRSSLKTAFAKRYFEVARNIFKYDRKESYSIYRRVKDIDSEFFPSSESALFQTTYRILGFYISEIFAKTFNRFNLSLK